MQLDLQGKKILITRESKQADSFGELIKEFNGVPIKLPLLKITTLENTKLSKINFRKITWLFFTSSNGVESFFKLIERENLLSELIHCRFAAVGTKTALALTKKGQLIDFIPTKFNADTMAKEFSRTYPNSAKILLVRGNWSRDILPREFTKIGYDVEQVEVYETSHVTDFTVNEIRLIDNVDFITFTSPSTVVAFSKVKKLNDQIAEIPVVCIGTTTATSAKEIGFTTIIIPKIFTTQSMLEALEQFIVKGKK